MGTHFETSETAQANRNWLVVDASGEVVGRLAARLASILRGKTNPRFASHTDCGDFVVVVNAEKIRFTGNKLEQKIYRDYTTYIGGLLEKPASRMMEKHPEDILRRAVRGMLPKTPLGRKQLTKLKIYRGTEHPHKAQVTKRSAKEAKS